MVQILNYEFKKNKSCLIQEKGDETYAIFKLQLKMRTTILGIRVILPNLSPEYRVKRVNK